MFSVYEAASMGLVEVARTTLKETSWLSEKEKQTKMKELMHDACVTRYNATEVVRSGRTRVLQWVLIIMVLYKNRREYQYIKWKIILC